jgi:hypothetical protein
MPSRVEVKRPGQDGISLGLQEHRENVLRQSHLLPGIFREHLAIMRSQER